MASVWPAGKPPWPKLLGNPGGLPGTFDTLAALAKSGWTIEQLRDAVVALVPVRAELVNDERLLQRVPDALYAWYSQPGQIGRTGLPAERR